MDNDVIAGAIVTYNPNIEKLKVVLNHAESYISQVIIVDNGSKNIAAINELVNQSNGVLLISLEENQGIAAAINIAVEQLEESTKWILTLDQDSVIPSNMLDTYLKYLDLPRAAIISPVVIDKRRYNKKEKFSNQKVEKVELCIQSGSLYNVEILHKLGGFNEWLFIDYVDYEYCYRSRGAGYNIYKLNEVTLNQEFGELYSSKLANIYNWLWRITSWSLFKKLTYYPQVNPNRMRYRVRNRIYCMQYLSKIEMTKEIIKTPYEYFKIIFRGKEKLELLNSIYLGTREGITTLKKSNVNR